MKFAKPQTDNVTHASHKRNSRHTDTDVKKPQMTTKKPNKPVLAKSMSNDDINIPEDILVIQKPLSSTKQVKKIEQDYSPDQLKQFAADAEILSFKIENEFKYLPQLGTVEQFPRYKPFINAVNNIGGVTPKQLYQLHQYTQLVLATQRHKIDLTKTSDGYYKNEIFPLLRDDFPYLNVTSLRLPHLIINQHIADALSVIPTIEAHIPKLRTESVQTALKAGVKPQDIPLEIVDVGSGGGVPATILAIVRPKWKITAIDSVTKKCNFLRHTADLLHLANFTVVAGSVQHYTISGVLAEPLEPIKIYGNHAAEANYVEKVNMFQNYDVCVARGVTQVPQLLPICLPLVKKGGKFVAMKSLLASLGANPDNAQLNDALSRSNQTDMDVKQLLKDIQEEKDRYIKEQQKTTIITDENGKKIVVKNHGEKFKQQQSDYNKTLSDFDAVLSTVLALPWNPDGRIFPRYQLLSLELAEGIPLLPSFGAAHQPLYINTDFFFKVSVPHADKKGFRFGLLFGEDDSETKRSKALEKYKKLFETTSTTGAPAPTKDFKKDASCSDGDDNDDLDAFIKQVDAKKKKAQIIKKIENSLAVAIESTADQEEGKVGETSKYLMVIDKVFNTDVSKFEKPRIPREEKKNKKDRLNILKPDASQMSDGDEEGDKQEFLQYQKDQRARKIKAHSEDEKQWVDTQVLAKMDLLNKSAINDEWRADDFTNPRTMAKWTKMLATWQQMRDSRAVALEKHLNAIKRASDEQKRQQKSEVYKQQARVAYISQDLKAMVHPGDGDAKDLAEKIIKRTEQRERKSQQKERQFQEQRQFQKTGGIDSESNKLAFNNTEPQKRKRSEEYADRQNADGNNNRNKQKPNNYQANDNKNVVKVNKAKK